MIEKYQLSPKSQKKIALLENEGLQRVILIKTKKELYTHEVIRVNKIAHDYWILIRDDKIRASFEAKLARYNDNEYLVDAILSFIVENPF